MNDEFETPFYEEQLKAIEESLEERVKWEAYLDSTYSSFEIMRALHIAKETFRDWIDRGFIKASQPSRGRGRAAGFTVKDIYGIALFMRLISLGFPRDLASKMVDKYRYSSEVTLPVQVDPGVEKMAKLDAPWPAEYILFRRSVDKNGNDLMEVETIVGQDPAISLRSGGEMLDRLDPKKEKSRLWQTIIILNYQLVRDEVDEALKKL